MPTPQCSSGVERILRAEFRKSWVPTAGRCFTCWTGMCTECDHREAGPPHRGSRNCSVTRRGSGRTTNPERPGDVKPVVGGAGA